MQNFIKIENLNVSYGDKKVLTNINFELNTNSICGLVGVNGAGKSTLFKSIMGVIKPRSGKISLMNNTIKQVLKSGLVSYVPQNEDIDWDFPLLVEDIVTMGRYPYMSFLRYPNKKDKIAIDKALEQVNLTKLRKNQIGELSGGQKKRVFVARSFAQNGKIILLDEPFTGIDIKTEEALINLFKEIVADNRLIVVSTHNLGSVPRMCDEVLLINNKLIAYGNTKETFNQTNLIKTFGGTLQNVTLQSTNLHQDNDKRKVTLLTDEERPAVFYGDDNTQKLMNSKDN